MIIARYMLQEVCCFNHECKDASDTEMRSSGFSLSSNWTSSFAVNPARESNRGYFDV